MLISIITATKNSADSIMECMNSVKSQIGVNYEHIIIDGKSNDKTDEIVKQFNSSKVLFYSEIDSGIYSALNKGIALAKGQLIGFLHSDDIFDGPTTLRDIAQVYIDSNVDIIYGDLLYVDKFDTNRIVRKWIAEEYSLSKLKFGWMPPHPTLFVSKCCYQKLSGYNETFSIAGDYEFILRLFLKPEMNSYYLPQFITKMRVGGISNRSIATIIHKSLEDIRALKMNKMPWLRALLFKNVRKLHQFRYEKYNK